MRRAFFMMIAVVATLSAAATDRFYIEDFSFTTNDTCSVNLLLDNEMAYTAFQFDLYLPDGLVLVPGSAALTERKTDNHTLIVNEIADGVIRLMSYSLAVKTFTGNSGALLTVDIAATNDFVGTASIAMRNVLFTTESGVEVTFGDEICIVTVKDVGLRGDVNGDGNVNISDVTALIDYLLSGNASDVNLTGADCNQDGSVNISDVTTLIDYLLSGSWN